MEELTDIKKELQQELHATQQHVEQHSRFNSDVWRRSVKRSTRSLYRWNILCVVILFLIMGASLSLLCLEDRWPWWLVVPTALFFGVMIVDNLLVTRGMARPDVSSREGLRSLRESVQASTNMTRWRQWFYRGYGNLLTVLMYLFLWFNDRSEFVSLLVVGLLCYPFGYFAGKRVKRRYDELGEEVDELLKE